MEACQNYTCTQSKNENPGESGSAPGSASAPGINPLACTRMGGQLVYCHAMKHTEWITDCWTTSISRLWPNHA